MKTMITRNNVPRHNGTMRCLLGRNGRGNFGPLLRGTERKHAEVVGRRGSGWEAVEVKRKARKTCGSWWKTRKGSEGVRKARKRLGRLWERAEEVGGLGKVTVRYRSWKCDKEHEPRDCCPSRSFLYLCPKRLTFSLNSVPDMWYFRLL